jgi:hypothetical protein
VEEGCAKGRRTDHEARGWKGMALVLQTQGMDQALYLKFFSSILNGFNKSIKQVNGGGMLSMSTM